MCAPVVSFAIGMLATIHFDNEMSSKGHKIYDVSSDHRLSLEFHALEAMGAKQIPKASLCLCHVGTKSFGVTECHTPLPARLRRATLSHKGRGDYPSLGLNGAAHYHSAAAGVTSTSSTGGGTRFGASFSSAIRANLSRAS